MKVVEIVAVGRGLELLALTDKLLADGVIAHRLDKRGYKSYGPKYRRLMCGETRLDLFMPPLPEFGYVFHQRTGDSDWSHAFVVPVGAYGVQRDEKGKPTGVKIPGLLPTRLLLKDNRLRPSLPAGPMLDTDTEEKLYAAYGLPFIAPQERNLATVKRLAKVAK